MNFHLSQVKDIVYLMFSLSSRSTLLIRNQLEVQVFSFPKCCKGVCCWWSGSFPVGWLGPPRSLYADRTIPASDEAVTAWSQNLVMCLKSCLYESCINICGKIPCCSWGREGSGVDLSAVDFKSGSAGQ